MIFIRHEEHLIEISGHAQYAPKGYDIVCSAVSVLVQTLVRSIEELTTDGPETVTSDPVNGYTKITFYEHKDLSEAAKLLIESFFIGINGVKDAYPDYVKINDPACKS